MQHLPGGEGVFDGITPPGQKDVDMILIFNQGLDSIFFLSVCSDLHIINIKSILT